LHKAFFIADSHALAAGGAGGIVDDRKIIADMYGVLFADFLAPHTGDAGDLAHLVANRSAQMRTAEYMYALFFVNKFN
jgi:hypothetical protein